MLASAHTVANRGFIPAADRADSGERHTEPAGAYPEKRKKRPSGPNGLAAWIGAGR